MPIDYNWHYSLCLSLSFLMAIFPGQPGLACLLELRMMKVVVTVGAIRRESSNQITTNKPTPNFLQASLAGCPSC